MKIAVCLSGEPRTFRHTHESVRQYFSGHDVDFFLHSWTVDAATEADLRRAYQPTAMMVEDKPDFSDFYRQVFTIFGTKHFSFIYVIDMCHGISRAIGLKAGHEKATGQTYDLVVRSRYDILMGDRADVDLAAIAAAEGVTIPNTGNCKGGYNDRFAMASSRVMDLYAGIAGWLPSSVDPTLYGHLEPGYHPEPVLGHYLDKVAQVPVHIQRLYVKLLRPQYIGRPFVAVREEIKNHHHASKVPLLQATLKTLGLEKDQ